MNIRYAQEERPEVVLDTSSLYRAFWRVRANRGIAGTDGVSIDDFGGCLDDEIQRLRRELRSGTYAPRSLLEREIVRPGKKPRLLRIPTVRDRVVQTAMATHIGAIAEPRFSNASHGYRPCRSVRSALDAVARYLDSGMTWIVDADISDFFDSIPHKQLLSSLCDLSGVEPVLPWLRQALDFGAVGPATGIAQGSPLSPLLANIYLHRLDAALESEGLAHVRYADDFAIFAASESAALRARALAGATLAELGLSLHPEKTRVIAAREGCRFLGADIGVCNSDDPKATVHWPQWLAHQRQDDAPDESVTEGAPRAVVSESGEGSSARLEESGASAATASGSLRTLYLMQAGTVLRRDGERFLAIKGDRTLAAFPVHTVDLVFAMGSAVVTAPAMRLALEHRVPVVLLDSHGEFLGIVDNHDTASVALHAAQFVRMADAAVTLEMARSIVVAKIANCVTVLRRYGDRRGCRTLDDHLIAMRQIREQARHVKSMDTLRGCEGFAARSFFAGMRELLGESWGFLQRVRRPPTDPINAMLSFGYTLLHHNVLASIKAHRLNPYVGTLHEARPGHAALASDFMEAFRAPVVDSLVLNMALNGRMRRTDFAAGEGGASTMSCGARQRFIAAFEEKMGGDLGDETGYRNVIDLQVRAYASHLKGREPVFRPHLVR